MKTFGIIGLGKMGGGLALQALKKKFHVMGFDITAPNPELKKVGLYLAQNLETFKKLPKPRAIFLYVPAGTEVDVILHNLSGILDKGDIIIDGGNSYWEDSIKRAQLLKEKGLHFIDCGTSGGPEGALKGACFMIGGESEPIKKIMPILTELAAPEGIVITGASGSGHFVKLIHNGIEFGMQQAIEEGIDLLSRFNQSLDIQKILHAWNHGSVIRSWLIELMAKKHSENK